MDEKKKTPEEEEKKSENQPEESVKSDEKKPEEKPADEKPDGKSEEPNGEEKAPDDKQAEENGEGADDKPEEKQDTDAPEVPQLSETDKLKAENLTLKTQLEAMKIGFAPDCMEDAVILAEAIVKRDGSDISAALQAVAKKYPDWKAEGGDGKGKGGFKVGAGASEKGEKADNSRLSNAFGIKKKK
nr:MAG: minor structural protein [Bacteriophage sp.]